ncbi:hypothetical protein V6N12_075792 [Hibiscus sabdariffa]|uniref:START domain-containing protein n=1 Tax=Hibiscus sabdariffa TaxID=183260 RepID=A0ABR2C8L9_9ROSI
MAMAMAHHRESSDGSSIHKHLDTGKYVRYTAEQVEVLERVYAECPKTSSLRRQQLIRECPILSNIDLNRSTFGFKIAGLTLGSAGVERSKGNRLQGVSAGLREWASTTDASCDSVVTTPRHSLRNANNTDGLLSIAEETLEEFLSKATRTAINWVQMPGMKPGPDLVGIFVISQSCSAVAARVCGLVSLEPTKNLEVFTMFPAGNGGTIELVYTQTFAPTRDFWTLRYTGTLENGSLVVCESSLSGSGSGVGPSVPSAPQFVRAQVLTSACMECAGGLTPLYESSKALRYVRQIALETSGEVVYGLGRQPAVLRTFSQRLSSGFNEAINEFNEDCWSILDCDGTEGVIIAINSSKSLSSTSNLTTSLSFLGVLLCAKTSMLLQNVPPAVLVRFLREHRLEWADFNVDAYSAASLKGGTYAYPGNRPTSFTGSRIIMPLGHTIEHKEICSGIGDNAVGVC